MKVLVPLNELEHVEDYIVSGAGEFYLGFYDELWNEKFGEYADINRMSGYRESANQYNFEQVLELIPKIKKKGVEIYITFNSSIYSREQLIFLENYMKKLKEVQVDGVIVSTIELVMMAKKLSVPSVVSTIGGVYNHDIAKFYQKLGTKRIILPRDLSIKEIKSITSQVTNLEYEIFMMRNGCAFSDSNCLGLHRKEMCSICSSLNNANRDIMMKKYDFNTRHDTELNDMLYSHSFHNFSCGLCAIYQFVQMGIAAYKIVGRSDEWESICKDVSYVKSNIEIAMKCKTEEEYLENMVFPENSSVMCKLGLSCYYPEVRFE